MFLKETVRLFFPLIVDLKHIILGITDTRTQVLGNLRTLCTRIGQHYGVLEHVEIQELDTTSHPQDSIWYLCIHFSLLKVLQF